MDEDCTAESAGTRTRRSRRRHRSATTSDRCGGIAIVIAIAALAATGCRVVRRSSLPTLRNTEPFSFKIALGRNQYQIEGYLARTSEPGRRPGLLVLNGAEGDARQCVAANQDLVAMGLQVACINIPGYGRSSGPSRFVGPQAVAAARRALDLLVYRSDVDPQRLAVWGLGNGAVAAGLLMDYDSRPRLLILQSGAYDLVKLWRQTTLRTKLSILREVWPSRRVLAERSVIEHLPRRLDCAVLILHGDRDHAAPVSQAVRLAAALRQRGARVETRYFPQASHDLGRRVDPDLRAFLRAHLLDSGAQATS
jgi:dipeptidyl aminopeptidase/acylaminoacyl peptidase